MSAGGGWQMTERPTPSQAEGERPEDFDENAAFDPPWTTPSQAEGERDDEEGAYGPGAR